MDNAPLIVVGILGCVFLIMNLILPGVMISTRRKMNAIQGWPSTMGTVVMSTLQWRRSSSDNRSTQYPFVQYSYQVGGRAIRAQRSLRDPNQEAWRREGGGALSCGRAGDGIL